MKSIGLIELPNLADAIITLDIMLKVAAVEFLTWEKRLGGRLVTIIITGEISSVKESVEAAVSKMSNKIVSHAVIANPHAETMKIIEISADRYKR